MNRGWSTSSQDSQDINNLRSRLQGVWVTDSYLGETRGTEKDCVIWMQRRSAATTDQEQLHTGAKQGILFASRCCSSTRRGTGDGGVAAGERGSWWCGERKNGPLSWGKEIGERASGQGPRAEGLAVEGCFY